MRRLLIISDTAVYQEGSKQYAYEPVMREVSVLSGMFDEIVWLGSRVHTLTGTLTQDKPANVKIVAMPSVRHKSFNALRILFAYPVFLATILKYFFAATHIHTRGPSHPALVGVLLSFIDNKRKYWHKYAGDWRSASSPRMYQIQRILLARLRKDNIRVTVNGKQEGDNINILSFENPCLFEQERIDAKAVACKKDFSEELNILFVGELSDYKGVTNLVDAVQSNTLDARVKNLYIVGVGPLYEVLRERIQRTANINIHLVGSLKRAGLNEYYALSHILILPSVSEGFPKVVAEAAAHGCIPVVTDISVLSNYITHGKSGMLMPDNKPGTIVKTLNELASIVHLRQMSEAATKSTERFTYEYFLSRIKTEVFSA